MQSTFVAEWLKFSVLLTPFFVLSVFLTYTASLEPKDRQAIALRVMLAVTLIAGILVGLGRFIFEILGITLDSFRVGAGTLLMLSGISLAREGIKSPAATEDPRTATVVPLAIPITIGPATTGALMVMGSDIQETGVQLAGIGGLAAAIVCVGLILFFGSWIERVVGRLGIVILSRLTGLVLTAIAAEILFTGVRGLLGN
jgi:multiple antibiotic resistance protein